jgi:hypothetical protein
MKSIANFFSKINIFPRRQDQHVHMPVDEVEDFRSRGCEILKGISVHKETTSNNNSAGTAGTAGTAAAAAAANSKGGTDTGIDMDMHMDWHDHIQKVCEFQYQEDGKENKINSSKTYPKNNEPKQYKIKRLNVLKRALERRRKFDTKGSFAVNMVTYRDGTSPSARRRNTNEYIDHDTTATSVAGCDDRSRSSISTMSNDVMLQVIDEETAYC